jgi:amino acid transporter/nucleotide-binding universal stress UspA family protein
MMGLGMMIGAGIFLGIGNSILHSGPGGVLLTFAFNGVLAIFTAMSYAELSSAIPKAGGAYNFARVGFGRGTSFLAGWMEWFASSVAGSLYAVTFAIYTLDYLAYLGALDWVPLEMWLTRKICAAGIAVFFIGVNYKGASETGKIGAFFTLGQTLFLVVLGVLGAVVAIQHPERLANFEPFLPNGWNSLLATMGFTYVAFEGFEVIAQAGDETIDPRRNLPKAMLYSVLVVTFTYVAVSFASVVAVSPTDPDLAGRAPWEWIGSFGETGFGAAVSRLMPAAKLLLTLAVIFASTSALNATIFSATRASYALGRDKMLPAALAKVSQKRKTPYVALLLTGVIIIVVATMLPTMDVASSASIMFLFLFFLVNVCVIKIRRNMADELTYGYLMPLFPVFPILAIVAQVTLAAWLVHMSPIAWVVAPSWIVVGIIIYHTYSKSRAVATEDEILKLEEDPPETQDGFGIMVAVANPENAMQLVRNTYKLCGAKKARVELLHLMPVPTHLLSLGDAERYMLAGKEALVETMLYLAHSFPVGTAIRYCRSIARGVVSAVREKRIDMLVMGWHGRPPKRAFALGSTVDPVIERSPCDVVVLKNCGEGTYKRVLVPVAGGPNGAFALEVASILMEQGDDAEITLFTVGERLDLGEFLDKNAERMIVPRERVKTKVAPSGDIVRLISEESRNYDLVVIGASPQPIFPAFAREPIPEAVARIVSTPLVMVKAGSGIRSWIKRWI